MIRAILEDIIELAALGVFLAAIFAIAIGVN
jgi:hypothetical protein